MVGNMHNKEHIQDSSDQEQEDQILQQKQILDWRLNPRTHEFLGFDFHPLDPVQTLSRAKWMTASKPFRYIVTPNVDHVVRSKKEPDLYRNIFDNAWLSVCDSRILELLANMSDVPLKAVPGSSLTQQLFENVITPDDTITVIGANAGIISDLKDKFGLSRVNHHEPPMGLKNKPDEVQQCAEFIKNNPARYVILCVGSPQQEMVAKAAADLEGTVGLGLCVGASLDFLTGRQKRAPKWVQNMRMEWFFRLLSEPRRLWKRYLVEGPKVFLIWRDWKKKKSSS